MDTLKTEPVSQTMPANDAISPALSKTELDSLVQEMFTVGAHYGYSRSRRHPSAKQFIFGVKNRVEIFDLEKTADLLGQAMVFVKALAMSGKQILFVGGKSEIKEIVKRGAEEIGQPYVAGRFIGGTLTNFGEIKKRVEKMEQMIASREHGEFNKYTKKERLMIDREIKRLEEKFAGLTSMKDLPAAMFVVDARSEHIAVNEAKNMGISVIGLSNSDTNLKSLDYPIPGNDASAASVTFFVKKIVGAYKNVQRS